MTSTAGYFVKRTLCDRLAAMTGAGQLLDGVDVQYAIPGQFTDKCVYFGGFSYDQPGDQDAEDGDDFAAAEANTVGVYVRIVGKGLTTRETETEAERIGDIIGAILRKEPRLCGPSTWSRISGGTADYVNTDDGPIVILQIRVTTSAYLT